MYIRSNKHSHHANSPLLTPLSRCNLLNLYHLPLPHTLFQLPPTNPTPRTIRRPIPLTPPLPNHILPPTPHAYQLNPQYTNYQPRRRTHQPHTIQVRERQHQNHHSNNTAVHEPDIFA